MPAAGNVFPKRQIAPANGLAGDAVLPHGGLRLRVWHGQSNFMGASSAMSRTPGCPFSLTSNLCLLRKVRDGASGEPEVQQQSFVSATCGLVAMSLSSAPLPALRGEVCGTGLGAHPGGGWEGGWGAGLSPPAMENVRGVETGCHLEHLGSHMLCGPAGHGCAWANPCRGSPSITSSSTHRKGFGFIYCLPRCSTREGWRTASENQAHQISSVRWGERVRRDGKQKCNEAAELGFCSFLAVSSRCIGWLSLSC